MKIHKARLTQDELELIQAYRTMSAIHKECLLYLSRTVIYHNKENIDRKIINFHEFLSAKA